MNKTLFQRTLNLLRSEDAPPVSKIARDLGLNLRWLYRLKAGDYNDSGVNNIERLHVYLKKHARKKVA